MPKILSRFEIGCLYTTDPDDIEVIYQEQFKENDQNNEKEKDID